MATPNWVAYLALLIWPLVAILLHLVLPPAKAVLWTILGAFLLLPVGAEIKFSGIPAFNKESIPNLSALACCMAFGGQFPRIFRGIGLVEVLLIVLVISPFVTSVLNSDPITIGVTYLPGVGVYDAVSAVAAQFIFMIPFFLGRHFFRRPEDNAAILRSLAVAGLAYSLPMLFEIRMSPQLHNLLYGYYPTDFIQEIRDGGFRPVVFIGHGLSVAFFAMTTTVAATALWRTKNRIDTYLAPGSIAIYLGVVLVLCKTASATIYAALLAPLVRWASPRVQLRIACLLVLIALGYPALRAAELIPTANILEAANALSPQRAESLKTRFDNEDQLLDRAWERPWFGWGRFGRSRVYNEWGKDISITDGHWIISMGQFGIVGFAAEFLLLSIAVFRAAMAVKFARNNWEGEYLGALALIVAVNIVDLLPNASISSWTWLLVGALLGRAEAAYSSARRSAPMGPFAVPSAELRAKDK